MGRFGATIPAIECDRDGEKRCVISSYIPYIRIINLCCSTFTISAIQAETIHIIIYIWRKTCFSRCIDTHNITVLFSFFFFCFSFFGHLILCQSASYIVSMQHIQVEFFVLCILLTIQSTQHEQIKFSLLPNGSWSRSICFFFHKENWTSLIDCHRISRRSFCLL